MTNIMLSALVFGLGYVTALYKLSILLFIIVITFHYNNKKIIITIIIITITIIKNLSSCSDTLSYKTVQSRQPHKPSWNRETLMLATAISNKMEAGNFGAVRLLCFEETVAPSTDET